MKNLARRDHNIIKSNAEAVRSKANHTQKINKDLLNEMKIDNLRGDDTHLLSNETLLGGTKSKTGILYRPTTREASTGITNLQVLRDTGQGFSNETVSNKLRKSTEMGNSYESLDQQDGKTAD